MNQLGKGSPDITEPAITNFEAKVNIVKSDGKIFIKSVYLIENAFLND